MTVTNKKAKCQAVGCQMCLIKLLKLPKGGIRRERWNKEMQYLCGTVAKTLSPSDGGNIFYTYLLLLQLVIIN